MPKWVCFILFLLLCVLDQITKILAQSHLTLNNPKAVFPGLNMRLAHNPGAAFSFLSDASGWQRGFLILVAIGVSLILLRWLIKTPASQKAERFGLVLILSGAISNLCDRVYWGYVIDFIEVYYKTYYWPAFNIADSAICVGVAILMIVLIRSKKLFK